ncbi:hypothetical protein BC629DRAFT_1598525 [Irpex lacteus]|nr:hypothetical protein BC629DRAFT_1598525 [Irpex lacteus]
MNSKKYTPMVFPDSDDEQPAKSNAQEARESELPKVSPNILTVQKKLGDITLSNTAGVEVKLRKGDASLGTLAEILQGSDSFESIGYDCVLHKIFEDDRMGGPMAGVTCAGLFEDQFKVEFIGFDGRVGPMQDVRTRRSCISSFSNVFNYYFPSVSASARRTQGPRQPQGLWSYAYWDTEPPLMLAHYTRLATIVGYSMIRSLHSQQIVGIILAIASGVLIGTSFVFKKKGLISSKPMPERVSVISRVGYGGRA